MEASKECTHRANFVPGVHLIPCMYMQLDRPAQLMFLQWPVSTHASMLATGPKVVNNSGTGVCAPLHMMIDLVTCKITFV